MWFCMAMGDRRVDGYDDGLKSRLWLVRSTELSFSTSFSLFPFFASRAEGWLMV